MALNATKTSLIRSLSTRAYSQAAPISGTFNYEVKTSVMPNKTVVAAADNESPIARVSILFRAGSRYESGDNLGATHVLRIAAGLSTCSSTQFAIARNLQQAGAILSCTTGREFVSYTLEGTRRAIENCMPFLTDVATEQVFKPWEIEDNLHRLRIELATRPPQQRAIDLLHKAAFRRGLGNSLYISKNQIGKISSETLQHFVATHFISNKAAVVGLGVSQSELMNYAQSLQLESGKDEPPSSKYKGGEIRSDKGGDLAYVAIAGEGCASKNAKEVMACHVLRKALGTGPSIKWANENQSVLAKSLGSVSEPHSLSSFVTSYSDTGLLGVLAIGNTKIAPKLVETAVKVLKTSRVSDADVVRAKNQLKTDYLSRLECGAEIIEYIGRQALFLGQVVAPSEVANLIDSVTTADVDAALKKVSSSKLSVAAYGNLSTVPFLDELKSEFDDDHAYVCVGVEGCSWKSLKEMVTYKVLSKALGNISAIKGGQDSQGLLAKMVSGVKDAYVMSAFSKNYLDTGLLGVFIVASDEHIGNLVDAAIRVFKTGKINDADVARAKNRLKTEEISLLESGDNAIQLIGQTALTAEKAVAPSEIGPLIDSVTTAEVDAALKKCSKSNVSIAACGNLKGLPYLDDRLQS